LEGFLFGAACADNSKSFATYLPFCRTPQFLNLSFSLRYFIGEIFLASDIPNSALHLRAYALA